MFKILLMAVFILGSREQLWAAEPANASPQVQLKQLMADLKKNPDDYALREQIIKLVSGMKQKPAIPQDAKRAFTKATGLQKAAKSAQDFEAAAAACQEALLIAPWWPEALSSLALMQEGAGKVDEAIRSLKLYLLTNPKDAAAAQDRLGVLESTQQFQAILSEAKKSPDNVDLREKLIKQVASMKVPPAIPTEARRPFTKAVTFQKEATSPSDNELAIAAYKEALQLAPWWPEALFNLALAQEGAGKFDDGISSLKLYLLTNPQDKADAETRMYAMEAKKEKAAKDAEAAAIEAARKKEEAMVRNLIGTWVDQEPMGPTGVVATNTYELISSGDRQIKITFKSCTSNGEYSDLGYPGCGVVGYQLTMLLSVNGHQLNGSITQVQNFSPWNCGLVTQNGTVSGTVSEAENSIDFQLTLPGFNLNGCRQEGSGTSKLKITKK